MLNSCSGAAPGKLARLRLPRFSVLLDFLRTAQTDQTIFFTTMRSDREVKVICRWARGRAAALQSSLV